MLYRIMFLLFVVGAAGQAADPCLAEDYAEANCARAIAPIESRLLVTVARSCGSADGTCCAQGGYKLEGHG
jgi:hypothetical protein